MAPEDMRIGVIVRGLHSSRETCLTKVETLHLSNLLLLNLHMAGWLLIVLKLDKIHALIFLENPIFTHHNDTEGPKLNPQPTSRDSTTFSAQIHPTTRSTMGLV